MRYIKSNGGIALLLERYKYHKHSTYVNGSILWRCSSYRKSKCPGTVTIKENEVVTSNLHTCQRDVHENDKIKIMNELREDVIQSDEPIPTLYANKIASIRNTGLDLMIPLPSLNNSSCFLYGARNNALGVSRTTFSSFKDIQIPKVYRPMILADYLDTDERILVFSMMQCRNLMNDTSEFFMDGTFKTCPFPFKQIFSLHGDTGSTTATTNVVPLIFALMTHKKESSYLKLFSMIKSQLPLWLPVKIHSDFEKASINAIKAVFPNIEVKGCYFHWCKNIGKKADKLKHSNTYAEKRVVGLTKALALLPSTNIMEGWFYIKNLCKDRLEMTKFINYVDTYWFKHHSLDVLSVFGERHRTNNALEGYHSKLSKNINSSNVTLQRLLKKLLSYQGFGSIVSQRKNKQIANDNIIMDIQMELVHGHISVDVALEQLRV